MTARLPIYFDSTNVDYAQLGATAGDQIDANAERVVNVGTPTAATDAATKAYVDAVATGLTWKQAVRLATAAALPANTAAGSGVGKTLTANANGALSVDGVAVAAGNRILVKNESTGANDGIYVVTAAGSAGAPYVLTRATDFDDNAEVVAGSAVFSTEGSANADKGWVLITNDPITVDTTALSFAQFSASTAYTFGAGLTESGFTVAVELDTSAGAQTAGSGGGSSGLEFDASGDAGKLRAAVNATGGIERSASGLAVKLNGDSLASASGGLSVSHAPSVRFSAQAAEALSVGDPVYMTSTSGQWGKALGNNTSKDDVRGITLTAASSAGDPIVVCMLGRATVLTGATPGTRYYLAATGGLTTTAPPSGKTFEIGIAETSTVLAVWLFDRGRR